MTQTKPIIKYDRLLNRFRENDFTDKEVEEIRNFINNIMLTLPKNAKLTYSEYIALEEYDDHCLYYITDDNNTKVIAQFIGNTPIFTSPEYAVFGESSFGNGLYN